MANFDREQLLASWFEGQLSNEETAALQAELDRDEASVPPLPKNWSCGGIYRKPLFPKGVLPTKFLRRYAKPKCQILLAADLVDQLKRRHRSQNRQSWLVGLLAAAAAIAIGIFVFQFAANGDTRSFRIVASEGVDPLQTEALLRRSANHH